VTAVGLLEAAAAWLGSLIAVPQLWLLAVTRLSEILAVCALGIHQTAGLGVLGLEPATLQSGLKTGLIWSAGFAAAAALLFAALYLTGQHPLALIRTPLPTQTSQRVLFFIVGGVVAPVAEEIVFRGVIFSYLRRWGLPTAVLVSTALFAGLHLPAVPVTQVVGGMVFAIAYHVSGSLMTPILIHSLGNLAIFGLSLPWFW
jgi:hypothetical protein